MDWLYLFFIFSSFLFLMVKRWQGDPSIRIDWEVFSKFVGFMAAITMVRFCAADLLMQFFPVEFTNYINTAKEHIDIGSTFFVFWEDVWFAMSISWIMKNIYGKSRTLSRIAIAMILAISMLFGLGHVYQGWFAFVAALYPFFVSRHYGEKYGFGTVMLAHMFYDFSTLIVIKNIHLLL